MNAIAERIALEDLTPELVAAFGNDDCLIWSGEHAAWWKMGRASYTTDRGMAGRYTIKGAYDHAGHCGPEKQIAFVRVTDEDRLIPPSDGGSTTRSGGDRSGYVDAFYGVAKLLGIGARARSPAEVWRDEMLPALERALTTTRSGGEGNARDKAVTAMRDYLASAGVPVTEFDPTFVVRMMSAMMVSFHKYGRVADAYPVKFDAVSDMRARIKKYRETGNLHFLADVANFAMIETMHPERSNATWGSNDAADSPGRTTASGHRLVQEDNAGNRIMGETILHIPGDDA